jgi:hypothetical protein
VSYDLHLYRVRRGCTASEAHDEDAAMMEAGAKHEPRAFSYLPAEEREHVVQTLLATDPALEIIRPPGAPELIQLCGPDDNPYDWCVSHTCSLSWTYTKSDAALARLVDRVRPGLKALYALGFRAFDPQLGRDFDPDRDFASVSSVYGVINQHMADHFQTPTGDARPSRPWWRLW